jgi:hypothetical protein
MENLLNKQKFFETIHYIPHENQQIIHDCPARFRIVAAGTKFGKSWCAAAEALSYLMYEDVRGWVVAPTFDLVDKVFREIYRYSVGYLQEFISEESESRKYLKFINRSEIQGKSAENLIGLAGEDLDFIIIDEASGIREEAWTFYLRERIINRVGWVFFISTPRGRGWYYQLYLRGQDPKQPDYKSFHFTSYDNKHVDRNELEAFKNEVGADSRAFRQEVMAEFLSDSDSVFRYVREAVRPCLREPQAGRSYVAGIDLAKYVDYTVVTIADTRTNEVVFYDRWHKTDWKVTYDRIQTAVRKYNNAEVVLDSSGVGDPIYETLTKTPYNLNIRPYLFTNQSKREMVDTLAWFFDNRSIFIPDMPELINELEIFEYRMTPSRNITFGAPQGSYHDDIVTALGLMALGLKKQPQQTGFSAAVLSGEALSHARAKPYQTSSNDYSALHF